MKFLKGLLYPFALLYGGIMLLRNFLYDRGIFKTTKFDLPVISGGNLTVGGTGKPPHVEYLLRQLQGYKTATLSRGYKRSTSGFLLANPNVSAATIGDEPFQYYLDFPETTVAVCEKRAVGIQKLLELKPETEVVILDDAFQHRAVTPGLNLLITDFYRRFDSDYMLPTGLLREPRSGARRADAVIVSKCPAELTTAEKSAIENGIKKYTKTGTHVFFTSYQYGQTVGFGAEKVCRKKIVLLTAIANASPLVTYLQQADYQIMAHLNFPDHHHYSGEDLQKTAQVLQQFGAGNVSILTTRKDAVKLMQPAFAATIAQLPFFYLPVQVKFLEKEAEFNKLVNAAVTRENPL